MNVKHIEVFDSDMTPFDPEKELMSLRFAQEEALTRQSVDDSLPNMLPMRQMPLDSAVAPFLTTPITPFEKTERKKAHTSAVYYSECFLKGVTPKDADNAASDIEGRYNKWWIDAGFHESTNVVSGSDNRDPFTKKANDLSIASPGSTKRPHVSDRSQHSHPSGEKRMRRRGGVRDIIQDNTVDPHEATLCDSIESSSGKQKTASSDDSPTPSFLSSSNVSQLEIKTLRDKLVEELKANGGDTDTESFKSKLETLNSFYVSSNKDARIMHGNSSAFDLDGTWLTLSKPSYIHVKGRNGVGQYMYSLGGMSFDMFRPAGLLCSLQGTFNTIHAIDPKSEELPVFIPRSLRKEVRQSLSHHKADSLRTYNIVVAFTIEPNQTRTGRQVPPEQDDKQHDFLIRRPIRGIMTNYGYILPDPQVPNRSSIWFTGGTLEVNDEENDLEEWKRIFDESAAPRRDMREYARLLAAKVLLGADASDALEPDGSMSYKLRRPIGGHGSAFCDVLYLDDSLRVIRGHHGSLMVFSKVVSPDDDRTE